MLDFIYQFPELTVLCIITLPVIASYILWYPDYKNNKAVFVNGAYTHAALLTMSLSSFGIFLISLLIVGVLFWGGGTAFSFYFFSVNWFWFSLNVYLLLELVILILNSEKIDIRYE